MQAVLTMNGIEHGDVSLFVAQHQPRALDVSSITWEKGTVCNPSLPSRVLKLGHSFLPSI